MFLKQSRLGAGIGCKDNGRATSREARTWFHPWGQGITGRDGSAKSQEQISQRVPRRLPLFTRARAESRRNGLLLSSSSQQPSEFLSMVVMSWSQKQGILGNVLPCLTRPVPNLRPKCKWLALSWNQQWGKGWVADTVGGSRAREEKDWIPWRQQVPSWHIFFRHSPKATGPSNHRLIPMEPWAKINRPVLFFSRLSQVFIIVQSWLTHLVPSTLKFFFFLLGTQGRGTRRG